MDTASVRDLPLKTVGKYQLLEELGSSAAGTTYRALDPFRKREQAVKIFGDLSRLDAAQKDRLYEVMARCAELSHRHLSKVQDVGEIDGRVYFARDLLAGADFGRHLAEHSPAASEKVTLIAQISEALSCAHSKDVFHGDIKPGNIFIADGRDAALLDFGVGAWQGSMLAARARLDGLVPNYLAPEQILGQPYDGRSDLFSLALVLYEAVTGKYPFEAAPGLIPREIVHTDIPALRELNSQFPEDLESLLARALAKKPEERIKSAEEFAASLYTIARKLRRDEASSVTPPSRAPFAPGANSEPRREPRPSRDGSLVIPEPVAPITMATALQPWHGGAAEKVEPKETAPALASTPRPDIPRRPRPTEPSPVAPLAPPAGSTADTPAAPAVAAPLPAKPSAAAATPIRPDNPATSMPRRFQRAPEPPPKSRNVRILRVATAAVGAFLATWMISSLVSRQNLHASQNQNRGETSAPKVAGDDLKSPPDAVVAPPQEAQKPVEAPKPEPAKKTSPVDSAIRYQVRPLWEAGKYADAMEAVDHILELDPASAEARAWKRKIRAAQDAEAAVK